MNKKKTYQQPAMQVIPVTTRMVPLCASGGAKAAPRRDLLDDLDDWDEPRRTTWND